MKLEYGKQYRNRNGQITTPLRPTRDTDNGGLEPFAGYLRFEENPRTWDADGHYLRGALSEHDLVEEFVYPGPAITNKQSSIVSVYYKIMDGRQPGAVDLDAEIMSAIESELPGTTVADLVDALRAESNRYHRIMEENLRSAPVWSAKPN